MKKTKLIGCVIIVLIICLIIVMLFIANLTVLKKNNIITNNNIDYNTKESVNNNVSENVTTEEENINLNTNSNSVLVSKDNIPVSVDDFSFDIKGVTEEMSKHIKNMDEFNKSIKEFIYKYGLFDATFAEVEKYEYQESTDRLGIIFKLNDPVGNRLRVIVNSDNEIDVLLYE